MNRGGVMQQGLSLTYLKECLPQNEDKQSFLRFKLLLLLTRKILFLVQSSAIVYTCNSPKQFKTATVTNINKSKQSRF